MAARLIGSKIYFRSSFRGLRRPNAVMGSAMRLGRGTNGTFSQSTSRLCVTAHVRTMETIFIGSVRPNIFHIVVMAVVMFCYLMLYCVYIVYERAFVRDDDHLRSWI